MEPAWEKELFGLIRTLKSRRELREFLTMLLTPREYEELVKRWQIVRRLLEGKTQRDVRDTVDVSIATVTRGSRVVHDGPTCALKYYHRIHS